MTRALPADTACRHCRHCNTTKPLADFPKHPGKALGHAYQCKPCRNAWETRHAANRTPQPKGMLNPMPAMTLAESLDCVRLRRWGRYEGAPRGLRAPALRMQG